MTPYKELLPYPEEQEGKCYTCSSHLRCVPLSEIDIPKPWAPSRTEYLKTAEDVMELLLSIEIEGEYGSQSCVNTFRLPRMVKIGRRPYEITDGIHRTNLAKELGLQCILAWVEDCREIDCEERG